MAGPTFFAAAFSSACPSARRRDVRHSPAAIGRWYSGATIFGLNYVDLMGLLAGSTTDLPALALPAICVNLKPPAVAYATVYPLTMLLRIISPQVLAVIFFGIGCGGAGGSRHPL